MGSIELKHPSGNYLISGGIKKLDVDHYSEYLSVKDIARKLNEVIECDYCSKKNKKGRIK